MGSIVVVVNVDGIDVQVAGSESLLQRVVSIAIRFGLVRPVFAQFGVFEVFVIPFVACLPGFCVALSFLFCFQFPSLV